MSSPRSQIGGEAAAVADYVHHNIPVRAVTTFALMGQLTPRLRALHRILADVPERTEAVIDAYMWRWDPAQRDDVLARHLRDEITAANLPMTVHRIVVMVTEPRLGLGMSSAQHFTFRRHGTGFREDRLFRGLHPMVAQRLQLGRLRNFAIERLPSVEDVYAFHAVANENPRDERLFVMAEVRDVTPVRDADGRVVRLPSLERMLAEALAGIRLYQSHRAPEQRLQWNRVNLFVLPHLELELSEIRAIAERLAPDTEDLGLDRIDVEVTMRDRRGVFRPIVLHLTHPAGAPAIVLRVTKPSKRPLLPLDEYTQKVVSMRRRGLAYPYEIVSLLAPAAGASGGFPPGDFVEYDLEAGGAFTPVDRSIGHNSANLVAGVIRNFTPTHPEGMARVILLGDPSRSLGALAEPECRRIMAALDLAERMHVPLEWFTLSSGARIAMDSGTENMDWIARVLRRIIDFTQAGGEINLVVDAINVGAQPYWNAEATMLMHTRGILIMTPQGAMVLTGKQALEYSGSVSAEDNFGIGGYGRIMGPNGQAQYWASDLVAACSILLRHYEHTYRSPGERFPRRTGTTDPFDRDVSSAPHPQHSSGDFAHVGDIFSEQLNPGRKKPFDIRAVMSAVIDHDHRPLERWTDMEDAANAVVWDAHLGGYPVCLIGMESHPLVRRGLIPADGPDHWTPGTLFPQSSKKIARAVNSASDNRPLVVLANLSGFDGSPELMRRVQLEFGAEIGRSVVNFRGPMVFCVISRYHGGAFVVFSATLNEHLEVAAVEGSFASVIGGAPAAAVVFTREVEKRTRADPRVAELATAVEAASGSEKAPLRARMAAMLEQVRHEKLGEVASEFELDPHRAARPAHGLGAPDHRGERAAPVPDRCRRAGDPARAGRHRSCRRRSHRAAARRARTDRGTVIAYLLSDADDVPAGDAWLLPSELRNAGRPDPPQAASRLAPWQMGGEARRRTGAAHLTRRCRDSQRGGRSAACMARRRSPGCGDLHQPLRGDGTVRSRHPAARTGVRRRADRDAPGCVRGGLVHNVRARPRHRRIAGRARPARHDDLVVEGERPQGAAGRPAPGHQVGGGGGVRR